MARCQAARTSSSCNVSGSSCNVSGALRRPPALRVNQRPGNIGAAKRMRTACGASATPALKTAVHNFAVVAHGPQRRFFGTLVSGVCGD